MKSNKISRGATLIEVAIALPIMLLLLSFIIDTALYLEAWSRVNDVSSRMARDLATEVPALRGTPVGGATPAADCNSLSGLTGPRLTTLAQARGPGGVINGVTVTLERVTPGTGFPVTVLKATTPFRCIFCSFGNLVLGTTPKVTTITTQPMEIRSGACVNTPVPPAPAP